MATQIGDTSDARVRKNILSQIEKIDKGEDTWDSLLERRRAEIYRLRSMHQTANNERRLDYMMREYMALCACQRMTFKREEI